MGRSLGFWGRGKAPCHGSAIKLNAQDFDFGTFKVMVTDADGGQTAMKLGQRGLRQINLKAGATEIRFEGGSQVTRKTKLAMRREVKTPTFELRLRAGSIEFRHTWQAPTFLSSEFII